MCISCFLFECMYMCSSCICVFVNVKVGECYPYVWGVKWGFVVFWSCSTIIFMYFCVVSLCGGGFDRTFSVSVALLLVYGLTL